MPAVIFHDGPCGGREVNYSAAAVADGQVVCAKRVYNVVEYPGDVWFGFLPGVTPPGAPVAAAPRANRSWRHLVHALVTEVPADLRKAQAARRHIERIGRRT